MAELKIKIPGLLEKESEKIEKEVEEFKELTRLKKIVAKSNLTEEQAKKLADEVNLSLAKKYKMSGIFHPVSDWWRKALF